MRMAERLESAAKDIVGEAIRGVVNFSVTRLASPTKKGQDTDPHITTLNKPKSRQVSTNDGIITQNIFQCGCFNLC